MLAEMKGDLREGKKKRNAPARVSKCGYVLVKHIQSNNQNVSRNMLQ